MDIRITPTPAFGGTVDAVASKSAAHRLLICAALADAETFIRCPEKSRDIRATAACLSALGANFCETDDGYTVTPISTVNENALLDCGESGTTYRFMLSLVSCLASGASLVGHGRLPSRPLSPLYETLAENGVSLSPQGSNPLAVSGGLSGRDFSFLGNVSSQYASGLLLAFPYLAKKENTPVSLTLTGKIESLPYLDMTVRAMEAFGVSVERMWQSDGSLRFTVEPSDYRSPTWVSVEGDYSGAAFYLAAGAIGTSPVTLTSLDANSPQGDREILSLLRRFGARVEESADGIRVSPAPLSGITVDASQIPDLVPILAVVAAAAQGETRIENAARLRLKESDRLETVHRLIETLGGDISEGEDFLVIRGCGKLRGGTVSAENDHRIAMSAAVASLISTDPVTILGAECAEKSYPRFYCDAKLLGFDVAVI
ncbi:MAG: 3-phosphoshikimate 1-carboxyvinyltransferase [Clostridia bacterium]|nr:3-phosphoshikimate 1-carboxyvinyltransferase [Clostridia bacterium]